MDFTGMNNTSFNQSYIINMRPVLNLKALFADTGEDYVFPSEPESFSTVKVRLRTAINNVDFAYCISEGVKTQMTKAETKGEFDYYECTLKTTDKPLKYYFQVTCGRFKSYYDRRGAVKEINEYFFFTILPGFKVPDWAKGAVMYQIYVDRFNNGDKSNDVLTGEYCYIGDKVTHVENWDKNPAADGVREFYGGDLQGVIDKMDYIKELGVEVIYFNPLFVSPSNHKYDIQDYDYIDPHFGKIVMDEGELLPEGSKENRLATRYINRVSNMENLKASNELFAKVCEEAHKRGMKVILDGVFNHCGSFNKWMDRERIYENAEGYEKGAYVSKESPYNDYFEFKGDKWPYNGNYDGWWGYDTLPKLNYEGSEKLCEYVRRIAAKWVSAPYNVDGWRLDVAADLGHSPEFNHEFWKKFRNAVKEANPNAIILAEHYGNCKEWLQGDEWDTVMNYDAFMEPVTWFLTGMEKHSDEYKEELLGNADAFWQSMITNSAAFTYPSLQIAMNELSNHDHSRFMTRTSHTVGRIGTHGYEAADRGNNEAVFREAVVMQMTWIGAPTIYYGDEAGVCGFTDPDNRRTYPWGHENKALIDFHKQITWVRNHNKELRTGSIKKLDGAYNFLAYGRFSEKEHCVILINNNYSSLHKRVEVWQIGVPKTGSMKTIFASDISGFRTFGGDYVMEAGAINIDMAPYSAVILKYSEN